MFRKNPTDDRLRAAQRGGDETSLLRERMRSGQLPEKNVILAAKLGYEPARLIFPNTNIIHKLFIHTSLMALVKPEFAADLAKDVFKYTDELFIERQLPEWGAYDTRDYRSGLQNDWETLITYEPPEIGNKLTIFPTVKFLLRNFERIREFTRRLGHPTSIMSETDEFFRARLIHYLLREARANPTDDRLRAAQRGGDEVAVLREKLRSGDLSEDTVKLLASFGYEPANLLYPEISPIDIFSDIGNFEITSSHLHPFIQPQFATELLFDCIDFLNAGFEPWMVEEGASDPLTSGRTLANRWNAWCGRLVSVIEPRGVFNPDTPAGICLLHFAHELEVFNQGSARNSQSGQWFRNNLPQFKEFIKTRIAHYLIHKPMHNPNLFVSINVLIRQLRSQLDATVSRRQVLLGW